MKLLSWNTFKKGARTDPRNCQPISLVSLVSKIIEKAILFQIKTLKKKIIYMYQSGFRTNHSTNFCPAHLIDFALTGMDKRMDTNMMLVNLQKVLDTWDHKVLQKMKYFGFQPIVIRLFASYLSNRKLLICINNVYSEAETLKYGVLSCSILGPLLFLLYIK